jgi:hypothetical protein
MRVTFTALPNDCELRTAFLITLKVQDWLLVLWVGRVESVRVIVIAPELRLLELPVINPEEFMLNPEGRPVADQV